METESTTEKSVKLPIGPQFFRKAECAHLMNCATFIMFIGVGISISNVWLSLACIFTSGAALIFDVRDYRIARFIRKTVEEGLK